ncbi:MAG: hypothetical protein IT336_04895 [Thermomicrobiales bacterium]|nr:hypothetical protein [Thermomicrobiales bacterium]
MAAISQPLSIPESWRFPLLTLGAMLALAGLDFAGAIFAKEWADRGHYVLLIGGVFSFTALFIVYARILQVAELSVVTLGWVVFLQVGILALDRVHYGVTMPWQKWAAIILILALQAYLIAGPSGSKSAQQAKTGGSSAAGQLMS